MSVALAVIFAAQAAAALPGEISFRCGAGSLVAFELIVPARSGPDGASGRFRLSGIEVPNGFERIDNALPGKLLLFWRREHNSPVALQITDYDAAAGAARYRLSGERNPASRLFTPMVAEGVCTVRATRPDAQDEPA